VISICLPETGSTMASRLFGVEMDSEGALPVASAPPFSAAAPAPPAGSASAAREEAEEACPVQASCAASRSAVSPSSLPPAVRARHVSSAPRPPRPLPFEPFGDVATGDPGSLEPGDPGGLEPAAPRLGVESSGHSLVFMSPSSSSANSASVAFLHPRWTSSAGLSHCCEVCTAVLNLKRRLRSKVLAAGSAASAGSAAASAGAATAGASP